ncbi:hypothetical protein CDD81_373 [Ophiocordyceps australis]|uniref:Thioredoxin-like fold domain-containing protein n=1 Tax=Ophiocordyceps australis TaxID=1399860 RepID=A0A2C5XW20_9HYPO|nr:hypothetical protein CDD81_373 [Ophiocordyceps australis]
MALPPHLAGQKLPPSPTPHSLELYLDYTCPFSARLFHTFWTQIAPLKTPNLQVVFRQQIQPWHPASTLLHEAALAVLRLEPAKFWRFSAVLFDKQKDFFDEAVAHEGRNATYSRLADLARELGVDGDAVFDLLEIKAGDAQNKGNQVTPDVKLVTKMNRRVGVHVTPTVVLDGVVQDVSSSWTGEQWKEWLAKNHGLFCLSHGQRSGACPGTVQRL